VPTGPAGPADLVVVGRILTLAGSHGLGEVGGIAIRGRRVIAAGAPSDIEALSGPRTRRLVLDPGELALPGLTDSHLHLADAAIALGELQLADAPDLADGLDRVRLADAAAQPGAWITGNGWAVDRWGGWPMAADLARVAPGRPVALWAHDHHALWVSEAALAIAGIDRGRADPPGGAIRRDAAGMPTGILQESATALVTGRVPAPSVEDYEEAIRWLGRDLVGYGVVAVHDPGTLRPSPAIGGPDVAYGNLADRHELPVRIHVSIRSEGLDGALGRGLRSGAVLGGDPESRARIGWLKLFADGSLGSRTAAMLEPFEPPGGSPSDPGDTGIWVTNPEQLAELAAQAARSGIATQIHAIGDAAVRSALDAFEPPVTRSLAYRARIEHAQLVDPADIARFGALGVIASIQPVHLRADAEQARRAWGARAERSAYAWGSLLRSGATLAFGTDAPVEPIDPWPGIALAMSRRSPEWPAGIRAFGPDEALSLDATLRAACLGPAQAEGSVDRGRLTAGQLADVIVIGADLSASRPRLVLLDGKVAYEA
jgi:hypothetical protein